MKITEKAIQPILTDVLSSYFGERILISSLEIQARPRMSLVAESYSLTVSYEHAGQIKELDLFLQHASTGSGITFSGEEPTRPEMEYGFRITTLLNMANVPLPIPAGYGSYKANGDVLFFKENLGSHNLERVLLDGEVPQLALMQRAIESLAQLHADWGSRIPINDLSKQDRDGYLARWLKYLDNVSALQVGDDLPGDVKKDFRQAMGPLSEFLCDRSNNPKFFGPIHGDCWAPHAYLKDRRVVFNDFGRVSDGPLPFDGVDLLQHPLINLSQVEIRELFEQYYTSFTLRLTKDLGVLSKNKAIDQKVFQSFMDLVHASEASRALRAAAKSALLMANARKSPLFQEVHSNYLRANPFYDRHTPSYMAQFGNALNYLAENAGLYGLDGKALITVKDRLGQYLPDINKPKPVLKPSEKRKS